MASIYWKPRSPGYIPGQHWVSCQRCGFTVRSKYAKPEWNGLIVCEPCWEPRHEQEFLKVREEPIGARGLVTGDKRAEAELSGICRTLEAIAGLAVSGCAIAGYDVGIVALTVPDGSFTNSVDLNDNILDKEFSAVVGCAVVGRAIVGNEAKC